LLVFYAALPSVYGTDGAYDVYAGSESFSYNAADSGSLLFVGAVIKTIIYSVVISDFSGRRLLKKLHLSGAPGNIG
jgi:hypothetical protein